MNYQKVYEQIVQRARIELRVRNKSFYYENHHITPRCLGGNNMSTNLVLLTAREHFICHWLLCRMYPNSSKLAHAFHMMCFVEGSSQHRYTPSSRAMLEAKEVHARHMSAQMIGTKNHMYGKKRPDLADYNRKNKKGVPSGKKGILCPNRSGELHHMYGKHQPAELRLRWSLAKRGVKQPKIKCPHCDKVGGNSNMKRYHFERCKKIKH